MEDPRLSRMYAKLVRQKFAGVRGSSIRTAIMRSGLLTGLTIALIVVAMMIAIRERGRGHLTRLESHLNTTVPHDPEAPRPGGQEAIVLQRPQMSGGATPELLSVTLLPGRGLNVLQITAYLPQKGEVNLLASPSLAEAATILNGKGQDENGQLSLSMGGAIEAPWAGRLGGVVGGDLKTLTTVWRGHSLSLPVSQPGNGRDGGEGFASGGLLLNRAADSQSMDVMPDGGESQVSFQAGDFDKRWISKTEIATTVLLSSRALEMRIVAHNVGDQPEPMGVGWSPRFAIPSGMRGQVMVKMPSGVREEMADQGARGPTGRLLPVSGTRYDFSGRDGALLGSQTLDECYVHLHAALLDNGPVAEMRDPASNYGLRLTAMSSSIKAMRVYAPADGSFVTIQPRSNYDDPFGREWSREEDTGMVTLQPGQSVQWKIRLELFSPMSEGGPSL